MIEKVPSMTCLSFSLQAGSADIVLATATPLTTKEWTSTGAVRSPFGKQSGNY
jgi:hypothetical protein